MKNNDHKVQSEIEQLRKAYESLSDKEKDLRVIHEFAVGLLQQETLEDVVWSIARNAIAELGFVDCVIYLLDEKAGHLIQMAAHGPKNPQKMDILNPILIPLGQGIVGTVALTKKSEVIGDTSRDRRYIIDDDFRYSEIAVPIMDGQRVIGVIDSEHPDKHFFTDRHLNLLQTIAAMSATRILHTLTAKKLMEYQGDLEYQVQEKTRELRRNLTELKKTNDDLEHFTYAASHDLAEPLRNIASFLQLIRRRERNLSNESREYISFAVKGTHRMRQLLDGLLLYTSAGKKQLERRALDPLQLKETVLENLSELVSSKSAAVDWGELRSFHGDFSSIVLLFQNLISNAIIFHHHERKPLIRIHQEERVDKFLFRLEDNGIGMDEVYSEKAFKLFGRLHDLDKYRGTGTGLAICKKIVENHGGVIWIQSQIGVGTSVYFTISKKGMTASSASVQFLD